MFQTRKWNWKRVATNLLLVPVLAGGSVAVVQAQLGRGGSGSSLPTMPSTVSSGKSARPAATTAGDSKQLLRDGRKALSEHRFAAAQDLAQAAESSNPSGKWGLFDDTPAALRKDIQAAMHRAHKAQADQLVKQARAMAAKHAANDGERAYNLDSALQMARKAEQLHGPYSAWDWTDRADKLVKELSTARAKLKVASTPVASANKPIPGGANRTPPAMPTTRSGRSGIGDTHQASKRIPGSADPNKTAAVKLMAEGKALADQGQFSLAKAKFTEADKLGAKFSISEPNPGYALQELNTRAAAAMDRLVRDGNTFASKKDYTRASAALDHAGMIASAMGLFPKPVTEAKAALWTASGGKYGSAPASGLIAAGGPEHLIPAPSVPGTARVASGVTEKPGMPLAPEPPSRGGDITGQQLLDQAYVEFKAGEFQTAERLATQAFNHGMQKEAAALLNTLDAEVNARRQRDAERAMANAKGAFDKKDYKRALGALVLIEPKLLNESGQKSREEMLSACRAELKKAGADLVAIGGTQSPDSPLPPAELTTGTGAKPAHPPGTARLKSDDPPSAAQAMRTVAFQKLRSEGLRVQEESQKAFGRGETDLAMQMLVDYGNRVRGSNLDGSSVSRLLRPIENRLDTFRMMKGQVDANARLNKERREAKEIVTSRASASEERKREVASLMRQCHDLVKKGEYAKAERVALQTKQLDPDEPAVTAMLEMVRLTKRVKEAEADKRSKEEFFLGGLNDNDRLGPLVTSNDPVSVQLDAMRRAQRRGSGDHYLQRTRTPAEYEIELKLEKPISIEFNQTPLDQAIENIRTLTGIPLVIDEASLNAEKISPVQPVTVKPGTSVATKNILAFTLEQAGLSYVVEHDMVKVTTVKKSKGRMVTKVFSVADLVTPVPNFALPDYANFDKMLNRNPLNSGGLHMSGLNGVTPSSPAGGLGGGQPASTPLPGMLATTPGIQGAQGGPSWRGGSLQTNPLANSSSMAGDTNSKHEQLIKLITSMVRPYSWDGQGGGGKVEFFDIGSALVVNQTADVISEVQDLLEALRRLQDLAVAVEVRIVSLAESFFERMGVDFSVNVQTHNTSFEPQLQAFNPNTGTNGVFRPYPYLNSYNGYKGVTVGLTPAGTFTPDLNVPIKATSFNRGIPGFGGYPNATGNNGGISLGLAFLNDIQVYTFMELAQGDMRSNIMNAPKLTMFNGQTATLTVSDLQFFVTNVQVVSVNGQIVFIPQNTPLPGPGSFQQGGMISITVQAVVSADRRFVRMNLPVNMSVQSGASVPLFPVTTFVTPVFEGGSQGQPIPFTQFLQQPAFTTLSIQTTVVCPDGGTVLLGGFKTLAESRNEFGPPFLSKIPYLNRLFKNVGVGRESRHVMIMVTPRIIINAEEEIFQTEGRLPGQNVAR